MLRMGHVQNAVFELGKTLEPDAVAEEVLLYQRQGSALYRALDRRESLLPDSLFIMEQADDLVEIAIEHRF